MKRRLLEWLGILKLQRRIERQQQVIDHLTSVLSEETLVGIDVHLKSPSIVIVFTRAAGGQIRVFDADIKSLRDLKEFAEHVEYRYGIPKHDIWLDSPGGMFKDYFRRRY